MAVNTPLVLQLLLNDMILLQVNMYPGLLGAEFLTNYLEGEEGVTLQFRVDGPRVHDERLAIKDVVDRVSKAGLVWIEPRFDHWLIDLDGLKDQGKILSDIPWLRGKARIRPELTLPEWSSPDTTSLKSFVSIVIRPESVVMSKNGIRLFISYTHRDEAYRKELESHLSPLVRENLVALWHDGEIIAGAEWESEILKELNNATIILLLISSDFIKSEFCFGVELRRALERHESGEARVIPIIIRPCDWKGTPFARLQALPKNGKPVADLRNRDHAYLDIVLGIRKVIGELTGERG